MIPYINLRNGVLRVWTRDVCARMQHCTFGSSDGWSGAPEYRDKRFRRYRVVCGTTTHESGSGSADRGHLTSGTELASTT